MTADVFVFTEVVLTVRVAVFDPAATVTLAGTEAEDGFELESVTTAPPAGALAVSVTVPVEVVPPRTLAGLSVTDESAAAGCGVTVSGAVFVVPLYEPEIMTFCVDETADVVTGNVIDVTPCPIVTLAGTDAAALSLPS